MSIRDRVLLALTEAMRVSDRARVSTLRLVVAAAKNKEIEKRGELDDAEWTKLLSNLAKQRNESIEFFRKGGRQDLVDKEMAELKVIGEFLPEQLSAEEVGRLVAEAIAETQASNPKDMGKVMKALSPKLQGRADGKFVSDMVKNKLASK